MSKNKIKSCKRGACTIRFLKKVNRWEVDAGLKLGHSKRYRRWFKTKENALVYADKINLRLKKNGTDSFQLNAAQINDAIIAFSKLKKFGASLNEAVVFYEHHHQLRGAKMTMSELMEDRLKFLIEERIQGTGVRDRTLNDYKTRYSTLGSYLGDIYIIEFSYENHWLPLANQLASSARRYENHLRILFNYAVEKDYIKVSPMTGKLSKAPKHKKPTFLEERQWRKLLVEAVATDHELDLLVYVILTVYGGLRPESEVQNLTWENINLERGTVFIGNDQTGKSVLGRTVDLPEPAIQLLNLCKRKSGPIIPSKSAFYKKWSVLREKAGFIFKDEYGEIIQNDWTHDVARHTAATMLYAKTQSKDQVKRFLGHSNESTMKYYINHGEGIRDEAERFYSFSIDDTRNEEL
jgi:integrase